MHAPARAAGLAALQAFLEAGFDAFATMGGAHDFLATVERRELALAKSAVRGQRVEVEEGLLASGDPLAQLP